MTAIRHLAASSLFGLLLVTAISFTFTGCTETPVDPDTVVQVAQALGWLGETENVDEIESAIYLGNSGSAPAQIDLTPYFPPVGSQGSYGTCVTWTAGYYLKSALDAMDNNLSSSQLASAANQYSPKDLMWAIDGNYKGTDCNGTTFEAAFETMQQRGIATMATVPYQNLSDCFNDPPINWDNEAASNKIENYRKINPDAATVRSYLAQNRPVSIGCRVGDSFLQWNSSSVITSDTYNYNGQHQYHALTVIGYDDNKGPRGAFKIINSWGDYWGANGFIWIDYDFFEDSFCFAAFVATNQRSNPDNDGNNQVDTEDITSTGGDLLAWELYDYDNPYQDDPRHRSISYNIFNVGSGNVNASQKWNVIYMFYNAYNANEWDILLYDYYTNEYSNADNNGPLENGPGISDNWWNNVNVSSGESVAGALYGTNDARFYWGYEAPSYLNGYYYLVIIADGYDVIGEDDESNNYYYFTDGNGYPLYISNGVISDPEGKRAITGPQDLPTPVAPTANAKAPNPTVVNKEHPNAYSTTEIREMIEHHKKTGALQEKVKQFLNRTNKVDKSAE